MPARSLPLLLLVTLIAPTTLALSAEESKDPRNFDWVEEGVLAVGGGGLSKADVDWLASQGFGAIADFRLEHQDPEDHIAAKGMTFLDMPIGSASHINQTQLETFIAWADAQIADGRVIYIHCANGWHRAATFAVAWQMDRETRGFDDVAREAIARRPGTVMRATAALLDLQAAMEDRPPLAVTLGASTTRPEPGGTLDAHVLVSAAGAPAEGARVRVWSEETRGVIEGTTDAQGRFDFTFVAPPPGAVMTHLYARASLAGFADGADNVDFLYIHPARSYPPFDVTAERTPEGLHVTAKAGGKVLPARIVVRGAGWTGIESSAIGTATFPDAPRGELEVIVSMWGGQPGSVTVPAVEEPAPREGPRSPSQLLARERAVERAGAHAHTVAPTSGSALVEPEPTQEGTQPGGTWALRYAVAAAIGLAGVGVYAAITASRRSGVGNR